MNRTTKLLFLFIVMTFLLSFTGCVNEKKDKELEQIVKEVNKQLPQKISFITTWENCESLPGKILKYNYVVDADIADIDTTQFKGVLTDNLLYSIKNNKQIESLKKKRITFLHSYKTKEGKFICEIRLAPGDNKTSNIEEILPNKEIYKILQRNISILNLSEGKYIEEGLIFKGADIIYPKSLIHSYMLSEIDGNTIDTILFQSEMKPVIVEELKTKPSEILVRNNNVSVRYIYFDKDDKYICSVNISPEDYK